MLNCCRGLWSISELKVVLSWLVSEFGVSNVRIPRAISLRGANKLGMSNNHYESVSVRISIPHGIKKVALRQAFPKSMEPPLSQIDDSPPAH